MNDTAPIATSPAQPATTWRSAPAWRTLLVVTILGLVLDIGSKVAAFHFIAGVPVEIDRTRVLAAGTDLERIVPLHDAQVVVPSLLELKLLLNPGAVFGMGAGKRWVFVIFTGFAIGFALWMFAKWTRPIDRIAHFAIGLVLAGGLGNLYDRVMYACVRDFLHPLPSVKLPFGWTYPWGGTEIWPYVSNIADLWLIIGIFVLVIHTLRAGKHSHAASAGV